MKFEFTTRNLVIVGFFISFVALIFNAIILAEVNNRLKAADSEYERTFEALREQTKLGNEGENKYDSYTLMSYLSSIVPKEKREDAGLDTGALFNEALLFVYASGNDLSLTDFRLAEAEANAKEAELMINEELQKRASPEAETSAKSDEKETAKEESAAEQTAAKEKLFAQSLKILAEKTKDSSQINYKEKLSAISTISEIITTAENRDESLMKLYPVYILLNERWSESVRQKQNRLAELELERRRLADIQSYGTFGALVLQMLGLGFVFLKDFSGQKQK